MHRDRITDFCNTLCNVKSHGGLFQTAGPHSRTRNTALAELSIQVLGCIIVFRRLRQSDTIRYDRRV